MNWFVKNSPFIFLSQSPRQRSNYKLSKDEEKRQALLETSLWLHIHQCSQSTKTIKRPAFDFQMSFIKELIQRTVAKFLITICLSAANNKVVYEVIVQSSHCWTRLHMQAVFWYSLTSLCGIDLSGPYRPNLTHSIGLLWGAL